MARKQEQEEGYQGWANYETWATALWIDNDRGEYEHWRGVRDEVLEDFSPHSEGAPTREYEWSDAAVALGDQMKESFEGQLAELKVDGMWGDLLRAAFDEIVWYEIAESLIEEE